MRVLFIGSHDWANVSNRVARAMNASGETVARVFTAHAHPLGYIEDMIRDRRNYRDLYDWAAGADWIISTGDGDYRFLEMATQLLPFKAEVKIATAHVGSAYRQNWKSFNRMDSNFDKRFIGADLLRFCEDDRRVVPYFAPPGEFVWNFANEGTRIGHSPTSRDKKGTEAILAVLSRLPVEVDLIEGVRYDECQARRARCQMFVDQLQPDIGGFGASAVEALAAGCAVFADIRHVSERCWTFFPRPPIVDVRSAEDLERQLRRYMEDREALLDLRRQSFSWANEHAGPRAVSRYWLHHLGA